MPNSMHGLFLHYSDHFTQQCGHLWRFMCPCDIWKTGASEEGLIKQVQYIVSLMFHGDAMWGWCLRVVVLCNKLYYLVSSIYSSFKLFLELEPQLRDVLYKFHESQYAACLKLLDEMKVQYIGDTSITLVKPRVVTEKMAGRPWLAYLDKFHQGQVSGIESQISS